MFNAALIGILGALIIAYIVMKVMNWLEQRNIRKILEQEQEKEFEIELSEMVRDFDSDLKGQ